ncbi:MAG: glycoside hydrolase family 1 protein [Candidatus Omnitrophica bacterium]|jgi:beta-glucosidase|nr:glycoside hydrolase family 1 protein [Candidatus Omnitrophota bacterium]
MQIKFPSSFLWGAALSSYQCEGDNENSDWWDWERKRGIERSGLACNHYNLFKEDFKLARTLNLNSLRLSIEWARVCPQPDTFSQEELEHYRLVIEDLIKQRLRPLVTLHHFTNPIWFSQKQGWLAARNVDHFLFYLKKIAETFKDKVDLWLIFNEPLVYIYNSFIRGIWPPGEKSLRLAKKALNNIITAYLIGYQEIKKLNQKYFLSSQVSFAKHIRVFSGCRDFIFFLNSLSAFYRSKQFNFWLIDKLCNKRSLDFIAVNYYCKEYVQFRGFLGRECPDIGHKEIKNTLGWDIYPQGLYKILLSLKRFKLPIIVAENGTSEIKDSLYESYLIQHLKSLAKAYLCKVDIQGYFWWSLLDNFEWDKGFKHRFGLAEVDFNTQNRKIRPFAAVYARICRDNVIEI